MTWRKIKSYLRLFPFGFIQEDFRGGTALLRVQYGLWRTWEVWALRSEFEFASLADALWPLPMGSPEAYHRLDFIGCKLYAGDDYQAARRTMGS